MKSNVRRLPPAANRKRTFVKKILIIGAGRSSASLIKYLLENSTSENWKVLVCDASIEAAKKKVGSHENGVALHFDANNEEVRRKYISDSDLVISMLPYFMHDMIARDCLHHNKHLVTASYVSDELKSYDAEAKSKGLVFLNEVGADPGIDHMSAMAVIDQLKEDGKNLKAFRSYTGGLVSPECLDNPWKYKFTWNPRNVVMAGTGGTAMFLENGSTKYIPYYRTFSDTHKVMVDGLGEFDSYANRDSLIYINEYNLNYVDTLYRGTLRFPGFCTAWNVFVRLGLTDDSFELDPGVIKTYRELLESFMPFRYRQRDLKESLADLCRLDPNGEELSKIEWLGLLDDIPLIEGGNRRSPARYLQNLLMEKWKLKEDDIDMIVMQHEFEFQDGDVDKKLTSTLVLRGDDSTYTAMAKGVGLPVAIGAKMILNDTIKDRGVLIPVSSSIYKPILTELEINGIEFKEKIESLISS